MSDTFSINKPPVCVKCGRKLAAGEMQICNACYLQNLFPDVKEYDREIIENCTGAD